MLWSDRQGKGLIYHRGSVCQLIVQSRPRYTLQDVVLLLGRLLRSLNCQTCCPRRFFHDPHNYLQYLTTKCMLLHLSLSVCHSLPHPKKKLCTIRRTSSVLRSTVPYSQLMFRRPIPTEVDAAAAAQSLAAKTLGDGPTAAAAATLAGGNS